MQSPPSSILLSVGGFEIHYYGLIMFIAILSGMFVMSKIAKKYYPEISTDTLLDILPVLILSSILGARIYYVIVDFAYYSRHLPEIIAVWNGGLSIHGALIGGIIAGVFLTKHYKISFLKYSDVFSYALLIGQAIGRFGNYFNCEAFGTPTNLPWKLFIPYSHRPFDYRTYEYFHPTFLYESIWNIFVFLILFLFVRKIPKIPDGTIFFSYLILYSTGRFFIEYLRIDSVLNIGTIPVAQVICVLTIIISSVCLIVLNKRSQ